MAGLLEPPLLARFDLTDNIYIVFKILAGIFAIKEMTSHMKLTSMQLYAILFFSWFVIVTYFVGGDTIGAFKTIFFSMLTICYFDYCLRHDAFIFSRSIYKVLKIYTIINAILLILVPAGFGKYVPGYDYTSEDSRLNFLGLDNNFIHFFLFALAIAFTCTERKEQIRYSAIVLGTMIFVFSGTGMIGVSLFLAYAFLSSFRFLDKLITARTLTISYIGIYLGIVVFQLQENFAFIIVDMLHKDITFTGRVSLWHMAMLYIARQPICGYGITEHFLTMESGISYSPHNLVLQVLLAGGVVGLIILSKWYLVSIIKADKIKKHISRLILFVIFVYLITSLTESTMNVQYLYLLLVLAYNVKYLPIIKQ